ncbi:helix-turn-helix transcriptional regulator [Pseudoteredinibacter isoporae]|nr:helix-turn-helix transcriptional regulator [Pseudoteredinibacter isoporae]
MNTQPPSDQAQSQHDEARELIAEELMRQWDYLGESFKALREKRGMSIDEAASYGDLSADQVRDFEQGIGDLLLSDVINYAVTVLARVHFNVHDGQSIVKEHTEVEFKRLISMMDRSRTRRSKRRDTYTVDTLANYAVSESRKTASTG